MKILGYRNGFRYMERHGDIYRNDYADPPMVNAHWHCSKESLLDDIKKIGPLVNEDGEEVTI